MFFQCHCSRRYSNGWNGRNPKGETGRLLPAPILRLAFGFGPKPEDLERGPCASVPVRRRLGERPPAFVPEGRPRIARRFNAGITPGTAPVPKGRLRVGRTMANVTPIQPSLRDLFPRPANPALKCRAILGCPSGTNERRDSIPPTPCVETASALALDHPSPALWVWPQTGRPRTWAVRVRPCATPRYLDTAPTSGSMLMTLVNGAKSPGLCVRMDQIPYAWQVATMLPS